MADAIVALVPLYGAWVLGIATFLSCLALPAPASLLMIAGGAFVASGDLSLAYSVGAALGGAVAGDQMGFAIGKRGEATVARLSKGTGRRGLLFARARGFFDQQGSAGVFLSRWLFSPLGPYVNFIGGAAGLAWHRFTLWGIAGEAVWVSLYIGLGIAFADQFEIAAELAKDLSGMLAALAVAVILGAVIFRRHKGQNES